MHIKRKGSVNTFDHPFLKSILGKSIPKWFITSVILVCILGFSLIHCRSSKGNKSEYKTVRATKQAFSPAVTALGTVKPEVGAEVRLGARIPGKVEHLRANIGDYVEKDQIVAELEKEELKAVVEMRTAELNSAKINLSSLETIGPIEIEKAEAEWSRLKAIHDLEENAYKRQTALFEDNLTSKQILDQAKEEVLVARKDMESSAKTFELLRSKFEEDLKQLKAQEESAGAALRVAEVELSYATLLAPISGIIASVSTQEGETVAVGLSAPTFVTIIDLDRLQVETYVDEVDIGKIEIGQEVVFTVEAFPSIDIEGKVVGIYPKAILRENVVFYNVMAKSHEPPPVILRPEMTASVSIFLGAKGDVLMVPAKSVLKSGGTNFVYVLEQGKPVKREVQVGWKQGRFIEIKKGLQEGEEVLEEHADLEREV